jgi:hypothetical protein
MVELFYVLCCILYGSAPSTCYRFLDVVLSVLAVVSCCSIVVLKNTLKNTTYTYI